MTSDSAPNTQGAAQFTPGTQSVEVLTTHQGQQPLATYIQDKGIQLLRAEFLWFLSAAVPCGLWGETLIFKLPNRNKNFIAAHLYVLQIHGKNLKPWPTQAYTVVLI